MIVEIWNGWRLKRKLKDLSRVERRKAVRTAARASAKILLGPTKEAVPVDTGLTKRLVKVRASKKSRIRVGANVIIRKLDTASVAKKAESKKTWRGKKWKGRYEAAWYAQYTELGTKYIKARHWMRTVARKYKKQVMRDFFDRVFQEIDKIAKSR